MHVVGGEKLRELSDALIEEFNTNGTNPDFTLDYGEGVHPSRSVELAKKMYGILGIDEEQKMVVAIAFGKADESSSIFNVEPGRADLSESITLHGIDVDL